MNVLAVGCHPDDLEIGCFGTLAKYVLSGHKVTMCHIASGNMGHGIIQPEELRTIRAREAENAAQLIGAEAINIDIPDLTVDSGNLNVQKRLIEIIRYYKPDIIITHNLDDYMRDHMETSRLVFGASFSASVPHFYPDTQGHDKIPPIYYMDTLAGIGFIPTEYVDISNTINIKMEALRCHESQLSWMRDHDHIDFEDFVLTCSRYRGLQCGTKYAEGFRQCTAWPRQTTLRQLP